MENLFIKEEVYQEFKRKMNKKDNYFTLDELINIYKNAILGGAE